MQKKTTAAKVLKNSFLSGILWLLFCISAEAQQTDSTAFTPQQLLELVRENHPVAMQAQLILEKAEAERLKAAGSFDPKLFNNTKQKYFDDYSYYKLQDAGLKIPTWFGLTAKAGYEYNTGTYLNPQNKTADNGLWYADLSITLGKGLFIDERRASLKQARLMQTAATYDVELALNDIYMQVLQDYWEWYRSYTVYKLYNKGIQLAQDRFEIIRTNALIGEEPFIDTLEAYIQYQTRVLSQQKAQVDFYNASRKLETHLWLDGSVPLELDSTTYPQYIPQNEKELPAANWLEEHPALKAYANKLEVLDIEQRWNKEQLKPQLDLSYKFLNEPVNEQAFFEEYSIANYQWGLAASFPIFLRKERAAIKKTDVKQKDTRFNMELKSRELENTVQAYINELKLTEQQLTETRKMVRNYQGLLQAEITKFNNGESSLFLINQREIKYLESSEKELELEAKVKQVRAKLLAKAAELD